MSTPDETWRPPTGPPTHGIPPPPGGPGGGAPPTCPRHPDVVSYVRCQRCGRPTCPTCQVTAPVGVHCRDCVAAERRARPAHVRRAEADAGRPLVTYGLVAVCVVAYLAQLATPWVTDRFALVPSLGWREPWRLLTHAFLHDPGFAPHLVLNAFMLVILGRAVEPVLGRLRYAVLCVASAFGGALGVLWLTAPPASLHGGDLRWFTPFLGASSICYGLMCAWLMVGLRHRADVRGVVTLIGINVVFSFLVPNIAWESHLGGGVLGAAVAWGFLTLSPQARPGRRGLADRWQVLLWAALVVAGVVGRYALVGPLWGGFSPN